MFPGFASLLLSLSLTWSKIYRALDFSIQVGLIITVQQMVCYKWYVTEAVLIYFQSRQADRAAFPSTFLLWVFILGVLGEKQRASCKGKSLCVLWDKPGNSWFPEESSCQGLWFCSEFSTSWFAAGVIWRN